MPINTHLQQISFNSNGPLVNLHSAKLTFPNMSHGTVRVRKIYCQEPKICYLVKYGFFSWLDLNVILETVEQFNDYSPSEEGKRQCRGLQGPYFIALSNIHTGD